MQREDVVRLLPDIIGRTLTDGGPLDGLASSMAALLDPVDQRLLHLDRYFDPFRAPTAMLPYLATWVDLGWLANPDGGEADRLATERLRRLIGLAPVIAKRRGTVAGLEQLLREATGIAEIRVRDRGLDLTITRSFHLVVELPGAAAGYRRLAELIVEFEKPIHLTHEFVVVG